jgi:RimJ/RimL family protein N-acetyltransferase
MPNLQPTLMGPRIAIRPVTEADWSQMFAAGSDPEVWAVHPVSDRYKEPAFREFFDGALASGSSFSFVDRATGKVIGSSRYYGYDAEKREIEIGWTFLAKAYWGGSYNGEIKRLMLDHAFTFVDTVIFFVGEGNRISQRAMEKIGGVRRAGLVPRELGGKVYGHVVFEICKSDWQTATPG